MARSSLSSEERAYSRPVNTMANTPALGCQIAPTYHHEAWPYDSDSSSGDSGETSGAQEEVVAEQPDIEKAETAKDTEIARPDAPTPLQTRRTKSSRRAMLQDPVGFWHWSMVRMLRQRLDIGSSLLAGWCQTTRYQVVAANE
jgi:hypothetical protein